MLCDMSNTMKCSAFVTNSTLARVFFFFPYIILNDFFFLTWSRGISADNCRRRWYPTFQNRRNNWHEVQFSHNRVNHPPRDNIQNIIFVASGPTVPINWRTNAILHNNPHLSFVNCCPIWYLWIMYVTTSALHYLQIPSLKRCDTGYDGLVLEWQQSRNVENTAETEETHHTYRTPCFLGKI